MEHEIINLEISYDINKLNKIIKGSLNTIIFDKPQTKNRVLEKIINNINNNGLVFYIDLETKFRVNIEQEIIRLKKPENLIVFSIIKNNLDNIIAQICSSNCNENDIIILDSINALNKKTENNILTKINRKLGIYLSLLKDISCKNGTTIVVITNFIIKKNNIDEITLNKFRKTKLIPLGGRVIKKMSNNIISINEK